MIRSHNLHLSLYIAYFTISSFQMLSLHYSLLFSVFRQCTYLRVVINPFVSLPMSTLLVQAWRPSSRRSERDARDECAALSHVSGDCSGDSSKGGFVTLVDRSGEARRQTKVMV
jgi:hypothetical protein